MRRQDSGNACAPFSRRYSVIGASMVMLSLYAPVRQVRPTANGPMWRIVAEPRRPARRHKRNALPGDAPASSHALRQQTLPPPDAQANRTAHTVNLAAQPDVHKRNALPGGAPARSLGILPCIGAAMTLPQIDARPANPADSE